MDFKQQAAILLSPLTEMDAQEAQNNIETPPTPEMGDFAFPCFPLAKKWRNAPPKIAQELCEKLQKNKQNTCFSRIEAVGGYVNFYIDPYVHAKEVITQVLQAAPAYGADVIGAGKTICIDYSSINIAKKCHIGHLSTTVIGHALSKIYTFLGYKCVGINHLGDWGTQFGKMIYAFKQWGKKEEVEKEGIDALVRLYVRFEQESTEDMETAARAWFKKIEDNDAEAMEIFTWFKDITLRDVSRIYNMLGITFDSYDGESFYNDKWQKIVQELKDKNLLQQSDGALVVDLQPYNMPPCLVLKGDGASLYATRDIAAALYRKETYNFDKCLYVVAYQQNLHFKQWFKVVELMGYDFAKDLEHVPFGMVSYEGQTLSTRKGHVVYLEELLDKAVEKAHDIIMEKSPDLDDKEKVAAQVGIGAVVFYSLYNNRIKDVDFWWDRALNFDGETGPYVQYTHARCCSVLRKTSPELLHFDNVDFSLLSDAEAQDVVRVLRQFPDAIKEAAHRNEPYLITRFAVALAQKFNKFYFEHRILDEAPALTTARLTLVVSTRQVLGTALSLLGIETPHRM